MPRICSAPGKSRGDGRGPSVPARLLMASLVLLASACAPTTVEEQADAAPAGAATRSKHGAALETAQSELSQAGAISAWWRHERVRLAASGGPEGTAFDEELCPGGYATGLATRSGARLDQVAVKCAQWDGAASPARGGFGGGTCDLSCNAGDAMVGLCVGEGERGCASADRAPSPPAPGWACACPPSRRVPPASRARRSPGEALTSLPFRVSRGPRRRPPDRPTGSVGHRVPPWLLLACRGRAAMMAAGSVRVWGRPGTCRQGSE
jgi:hypothetical protein